MEGPPCSRDPTRQLTGRKCVQRNHAPWRRPFAGTVINVRDHGVLVQSNACFRNTNGIGIFNRAGLKDSGRHLIGLNMLYDNDEDDLRGMQ